MLKKMFSYFTLPLLLLFSNNPAISLARTPEQNQKPETGILEKMIPSNGIVTMNLDVARLGGNASETKGPKEQALSFSVNPGSFFTALVFNNVLRGPDVGSLELVPKNAAALPALLKASADQLVIEKLDSTEAFDLIVRDGKTGFRFFNISGHSYDYDATKHVLTIKDGRLQIAADFAAKLGNPAQSNAVAGKISVTMTVYPIEIDNLVNGDVRSATMPPMLPSAGTIPGPDVIVGDLPSVEQGGSSGSFVGLGVGTTSCNAGVVNLDWFQLPSNDHPAIPQNMYRMSSGADNTERFEQIGQSWCKHAFTALTGNVCSYGCNGTGGSHLGSGCSDPYSASLNYGQSGLGSRAWVNPFTGVFPPRSGGTDPANHTGHSHSGTSHRLLIAVSDLVPASNPGATYFAEGQYVTPHEYLWCNGDGTMNNPPHHGECNMYNNVSYRRFTPSGTTTFSFAAVGATVRTQPAINAWTGATRNTFEPDPGNDGIGVVGYKVTNPSAGVWHYEYAVYNQNLDRSIQSFSVPIGCGVTLSNLGFHAPPQHPAFANDGTLGSAGYSSTAWSPNQTATNVSWSSETFAQNQNANALRWGTLYNFRFDSNKPPQAASATLTPFKTGNPFTVPILAPTPDACNALQVVTAVSRKTHGAAGDFDIDLPLSGEPGVECRSGGMNGDHTVVVTFTNNVVSGNASVTSGTGSVAGTPAFASNTMTVNVTGVADVQNIDITLNNVTDSFAQTLPNTVVTMNILMGDTSGNKGVSSTDLSETKAQSGNPTNASNFREDVVPDGSINSTDITAVKARSGSGVP